MFKLTNSGRAYLFYLLRKYKSFSGLSEIGTKEMETLKEIQSTGFMEELDWDTISFFLQSRYIEGKDV